MSDQAAGFLVALTGLPLLTSVLANLRGELSLPSNILLFLVGVIGVALVGGLLTPGGGLTIVLTLPAARPEDADPIIVDRVADWGDRLGEGR